MSDEHPEPQERQTLTDAQDSSTSDSGNALSERHIRSPLALGNLLLSQIDEVVDRAEAAETYVTVTGLHTGFEDLDYMTSGLQPGDLSLVTGKSGMGRTAFILNVAANVALLEKVPVLVFGFGICASEVARQLVASTGRVDIRHLKNGMLSDEEWKSYTNAVDELSKCSLFIDDRLSLSAEELLDSAIQTSTLTGSLGLVVVDGLNWIDGIQKLPFSERYVRMDYAARVLKQLARDLNCHVMVTADLKVNANAFPLPNDLYGPATLPSIADLILSLYREEVFNYESKRPGEADLTIVKQAQGPVGTVRLAFHKRALRFDNLATPDKS